MISLIYFERVAHALRKRVTLDAASYRAAVLVAVLLASKMWDDASMENGDLAAIADWPLSFVNRLEVVALEALDFRLALSAGEYTDYFFKLRCVVGTWAVAARKAMRSK